MVVVRGDEVRLLRWTADRQTTSPWITKEAWQSGGWVYYTYVRGGTTFLSSDILRVLLEARQVLPIEVPERLLVGPFHMLSNLRQKQPGSDVESYRYDAGGSFWGAKDLRADVGRIAAAELACVRYCQAKLPHEPEQQRTQAHLGKALGAWAKHRGILDLIKGDHHGPLSIAPWYWRYSYLTTLEAANSYENDDQLRDRIQALALKAYFQTTRYEERVRDMGGPGWRRTVYDKKELLDTCLMLDGLAQIKHLYVDGSGVAFDHPRLADAAEHFRRARYGEAWALLDRLDADAGNGELARQAQAMRGLIEKRFKARWEEVQAIHKTFPRDGARHAEAMQPHFKGMPAMLEAQRKSRHWGKAF